MLSKLPHLSSFAAYLLEQHLTPFSNVLIKLGQSVNLSLLKSFSHHSKDELLQITNASNTNLLSALKNGTASEYIEESARRFNANEVVHIRSSEVESEDITLIVYIRKQAFLHFVPLYSTSVEQAINLVQEIDRFLLAYETALMNTYATLARKRLQDRNLFIETVNNTLPGAVYIFDLEKFKNVYATEKLQTIIDYSYEELNALGAEAVNLIHPDDRHEITDSLQNVLGAPDGTIISYKYRIKLKNGNYRWVRNYETPFKRDDNGTVCQLIAIVLDIDKEKKVSEELKRREQELLQAQKLYKQAQAISHLGHFTIDLKSRKVKLTEEASRIYGLTNVSTDLSYDDIVSMRHPDDYENTKKQIQHTLDTQDPFDFFFRIIVKGGEEKTIHTLGEISFDEGGKATHLVGTIQDVTERHRLISKWHESEKLYKQAQSLARLGNWLFDLQTEELTFSEEMRHIYQLPANVIFTAEMWKQFIHPDDRDDVLDYLQQCIEKKEPYDKVHRIVLPDETIKVVHRKGEFTYDETGKPQNLVGTTQDVTAQYKIQEELKENQLFLRKITDATPSIISSYNAISGKFVFLSEGIKKLLGYQTAEVIDKGMAFILSIIHPDDVAQVIEKTQRVIEEANRQVSNNEFITELNYRMLHKNGNYRSFHTYGTIFDRNKSGRVEHLLNITLDVTEQVSALERIAEQEIFIQQVADASPTILYIFDVPSNSINYINKEIFFVLGYTTQEIIAMESNVVEKLYNPEEYDLLPERAESSKHFQHQNSMIQYECRIRGKDEEWKWILVREVVFKTGEDQKPMQILGAALDITQRKEMERSLLQNAFQLEQSNASLEEFAYVASHDLKEPLRKISTFGDRLITTQANNITDEGRNYLDKIINASLRMQTMIDDLLSISLISGDQSFQLFSLQEVLEDALQTLEYKIETKNALVEAKDLPEIQIVVSQFRQLFQNLLSNSLKFIPEDRQPAIKITSTYLQPEEVQQYQITKASKYLKLEFNDNGIGFEDEYAGKIFQIFQRLHGRSEYEGTGIGLAICKKIVEHHGGIIYASGQLNSGATFTIILPA